MAWRVTPRDPYLSLVSEFMLQQTQVSRVQEKFGPFIGRFPTVGALARAREQDVLAAWSGLGYYRRARLLHGAARAIVAEHGGVVPRDAAVLRGLPGVGRYTAGAIASIVFGVREPIVDGNVARVLLRVHGRELAAADPAAVKFAWDGAADVVRHARSPGVVNEGLMELGAVVCTARGARCGVCPLRRLCAARRAGLVERIPAPREMAARRPVCVESAVIRDARGRVLMQRRGKSGMWASMWQLATLERDGARWPAADARQSLESWLGVEGLRSAGRFVHVTSHREVRVRVWSAARPVGRAYRPGPGLVWKTAAGMARLGVSSLQRRVLACASCADVIP